MDPLGPCVEDFCHFLSEMCCHWNLFKEHDPPYAIRNATLVTVLEIEYRRAKLGANRPV